jgi:hypothetical protein
MGLNLATLAPLKLGTTVLPVRNWSLDPGLRSELDINSGHGYATAHRLNGANPRLQATVPFRAAYDLLGRTVNNFSVMEAYLTRYSSTTLLPLGSTSHPKFSLSASCYAAVWISGVTCSPDGVADAIVEILPISNNGTTKPVEYSNAGTLPTLAAMPVLHTLGPISTGGTVRTGVAGMSVDFGLDVKAETSDGGQYPIAVAQVQAMPSMTVEHADPYALTTALDLDGSSVTQVILYLRQYNATTKIIDSGATAVSFTSTGRNMISPISAGQGEYARTGISIACVSSDGTTHPIAIAINATAPALA